MTMRRLPSPPPVTTPDLLATLEETLTNLREFTERLRTATAEDRAKGQTDQ